MRFFNTDGPVNCQHHFDRSWEERVFRREEPHDHHLRHVIPPHVAMNRLPKS